MRFNHYNSILIFNRAKAVLFSLLLSITIIGCEDDPLLEEMNQSGAGGSYGKMIFPGDTVNTGEKETLDKSNPVIF